MNWRTVFALAALCLLSGSAWLLDEASLVPLTGLSRPVIHFGTLCIVFALIARPTRGSWRHPAYLRVALWSAALMALPLVLATASAGHLSSFTTVLAFALVPACTVFLAGQTRSSFGHDTGPFTSLLPALASLGGLALLVPFTAPSSSSGTLSLTAVLASAGLAAYAGLRLHHLLKEVPILPAAAVASAAIALLTAMFCWLSGRSRAVFTVRGVALEAASCLFLEAPALLLTLWLLRKLDPIAFSTRYLLIPLVTIVEGFFLLRPEPTWTMLLGAILTAGGSFLLLRDRHQT